MATNVFDDGSYNHHEFKNSGLKMVNIKNIGRQKAVKISQNISATGGLGNLFSNGNANISFLLPIGTANVLDVCESMILELTLQNNDVANPASLLASHFLLTNIQTLTNGIKEQSYPEDQMLRRLYLSKNDEEITQCASMENFSYTYAAGYDSPAATVAASGTKKIYLQLFTPIDTAQLFLPAITQQITVQVYFNNTAVTSASLSTSVGVQSMRLIMNGFKFEDNIRQSKLALFASKDHYYSYNVCQREVLSSISVSAVNESAFQLSAFSGFKLPSLFLMIRPANAAQENLYAFDRIGQLDERINGQSVYLSPLDYEQFSFMAINDAGICTSVPNSATNVLLLPHSCDVYQSLKENKQRGYIMYNPNVSQILQMDTVTAVRDMVAIGRQAVAIRISKGGFYIEYL